MPERIDAHLHVWDLAVRPQEWTDDLPPLNRTYWVEELNAAMASAGIDGGVLVETINVAPETEEFLALAATHPTIRAVVGWVDLRADDVADQLARLRELPGGEFLVGVRHQVQLESDPEWLLRPDVLRGLRAVADAGLAFDLLVRSHQLPAAIGAVRSTPGGRFVLAHLGKPDIAQNSFDEWAPFVADLASAGEVACKLSGLVTEASPDWTIADLAPYADHALDAFGADRVMAGSDWPVCLLAATYLGVWDAHRALVSSLSTTEQDEVLGGTAQRWYRL